MMRQYELVERVTSYKPDADENLLNKAYVYAMTKHGSQIRASGDPYFSHPLEVAAILTDLKLDEETVAVALLHDTIEDTEATRKEIDQIFGNRIGILVEGLTKLKRLDLVSKKTQQAENLRRLFLAICEDIRVLLVKLADRLHNMRTLDHVSPDRRMRIATETMEIYAPLAGRMGMRDMREELEELAFRHINLQAHATVTQKLTELSGKNQNLIVDISQLLSEKLLREGVSATITSRQKSPYSIFRKMEHKTLGFEQLSDIHGFRIIVKDIAECYQALGIVHQAWSMVPGQFKDYISIPKQNEYRSIHTQIVGPSRQRVELQIRTEAMHEVAEYGIAAHSLYKDFNDSIGASKRESLAYAWLRRTIELLSGGDSPEEFLEHTKLELFQDQVFCFTPKGTLIALPSNATPIDFAYAVHTDVGNSCIGCKINGQITALMNKLKNGDEVEIIRSNSQTPPSAWESVVLTGKARSAIRRATRSAISKQYSSLGMRILEQACERAGKVFHMDQLEAVLPKLARESVQNVLTAIGRGELSILDVLKAIDCNYHEEDTSRNKVNKQGGWFGLNSRAGLLFRLPGARRLHKNTKSRHASQSIPVRGLSGDFPVRFSQEGGAVPGDRIVGIMEPGKGITIYPIQSPLLAQFDDQRENWLDVRWDIDEHNLEQFPARLLISAINKPGTLLEIASIIADHEANIHNLTMLSTESDFTEMQIDLEVWNLNHLTQISKRLRSQRTVATVLRING